MKRPAFIAEHSRRPRGIFGRIVAHVMACETYNDNRRAIEMLAPRPGEHILDIGSGHGRALKTICCFAKGVRATGVDDSPVMNKLARKRNARLIKKGRVQVTEASSDAMPFPDESFDAAMSMHTIYFWSEPAAHLNEIARVLRPGGRFVLGFRPKEDRISIEKFPPEIYTFRTAAEVKSLVSENGFSVEDSAARDKPGDCMVWIEARRTQT